MVFPRCQTHPHAQEKSSEEAKLGEETRNSFIITFTHATGSRWCRRSVGLPQDGHLSTLTLGLPGVKGHQKWSLPARFLPSSS